MAKAKSTVARSSDTVDLKDLEITMRRPRIFGGDADKPPFTVDGDQLATMFRYAALSCPGGLDAFAGPKSVGLTSFELMGVGEMCLGLASSDLHSIPVDCQAVFSALGDRLRDLANRLQAGDVPDGVAVTIRRKKAVA